MADSDRFVQIPYAGLSPTDSTVRDIGVSGNGGSTKIACYINDSAFQVQPVYYCKIATNIYGYYFSVYNTNHSNYHMSLKYATSYGSASASVYTNMTVGTATVLCWSANNYQWIVDADLEAFNTTQEAAEAFMNMFPSEYVNIQYVGNGCSVAGPSYVMQGTGILVPVTLPIGTTLSADNISVTKNGATINFNYNPQTQQIAFTAI